MNNTDRLIQAINELFQALNKVQDWESTRVGDCMEKVDCAILAVEEDIKASELDAYEMLREYDE